MYQNAFGACFIQEYKILSLDENLKKLECTRITTQDSWKTSDMSLVPYSNYIGCL